MSRADEPRHLAESSVYEEINGGELCSLVGTMLIELANSFGMHNFPSESSASLIKVYLPRRFFVADGDPRGGEFAGLVALFGLESSRDLSLRVLGKHASPRFRNNSWQKCF